MKKNSVLRLTRIGLAMRSTAARALFVLVVATALMAYSSPARAITVDLTSGTTGTVFLNQSFNGETRAADVTLLGSINQQVSSMTVVGVDIRNANALVGARIYDNSTAAIATANLNVPVADDQTITIPISATLIAGSTYRVGFFVPSAQSGNNGDMFDPDPASVGGFGYTESQGLFKVDDAFSIVGDIYPTLNNIFSPRMSLVVRPVPEPSVAALLALGVAWLSLRARRFRSPTARERPVRDQGRTPIWSRMSRERTGSYPVFSGFVDSLFGWVPSACVSAAYAVSMSGSNGCWRGDSDRNGFRTARAFLTGSYVKPSRLPA